MVPEPYAAATSSCRQTGVTVTPVQNNTVFCWLLSDDNDLWDLLGNLFICITDSSGPGSQAPALKASPTAKCPQLRTCFTPSMRQLVGNNLNNETNSQRWQHGRKAPQNLCLLSFVEPGLKPCLTTAMVSTIWWLVWSSCSCLAWDKLGVITSATSTLQHTCAWHLHSLSLSARVSG